MTSTQIPPADPDRAREIGDELAKRSVPILAHNHSPPGSPPNSVGTGALVELFGRYFMLTAGHCVRDVNDAKHTVLIINYTEHLFTPVLVRSEHIFRDDGIWDFGFIEIAPHDAATINAARKMFTGITRLDVRRADAIAVKSGRVIVAGYPREEAIETTNEFWARCFTIDAPVATPELVPRSPLPPATPVEVVDLWMKRSEAVDSYVAGEVRVEIPTLAGLSGGGCWFPAPPITDTSGWHPKSMKLVGIHIGSARHDVAGEDGEKHLFTRMILIGHHLRMIADHYPDLRAKLFEQWPTLTEFISAP